jgi:hypothetical protein
MSCARCSPGARSCSPGARLAALTGVCRRLRELGAERPFLLATGIGTGEVPGPDEAEWCVVEVRAPDVVAEIRAAMRLLRLLPDEVVDALDRWDPERQALVLSPMFNELPQIAGRRVYGPRRPEWRRRLLPALGPRRAGRGRGGGLPGRRLRPGAGDAIPRGHPVQHPRDRVPRRGGHVPAGRDGHPAPSGVDPPALRRGGHLLGPARRGPGGHARPGPPSRGGTAPTGRLPGRLHRRGGARGRGIPAHRAEPAPAAPGR